MRFRVIGADRITGEERELILSAADTDAAGADANSRGLLVSDCVPLDEVPHQATKTCPFCAETINAKAIKCRWCGEMLGQTPPVAPLSLVRPQQKRATPIPLPSPSAPAVATTDVPAVEQLAQAGASARPRNRRRAKPTPATRAVALGCGATILAFVIVIAVVIGLIAGAISMLSGGGGSASGDSEAAATPVSHTSFAEFDSKFCVHSRLTDLQKSHEINGFTRKRVRWEGIVSYVSDDSVGFKHKATTATYDVLLHVSKKERPTHDALLTAPPPRKWHQSLEKLNG